ncbi:MAG TPA: hypothetical protein VNH13_10840, partial [Candidatus Acidoferrales bacterium]|nr:hypothetical protein [Candidatus Acidoferrales bacterium]
VEVRQPDEPMGVIPVIVGGLGWLDPARGTLQRAALSELGQWLFALPEGGTACACFDVANDGGSSLHLYLFDRTGTLHGARTVPDWTPPGTAEVIEDAVLEPDGSGVIAAVAVQGPDTWRLKLADLAFGSSDVDATTTANLDLASFPDQRRLTMGLALSPDGNHLRITVRQFAGGFGEPSSVALAWVAERESGTWTAPRAVTHPGFGGRTLACGDAAWATNTDYVSLCLSPTPDDNGMLPSFLEIDRGDRLDDVELGEIAFQEPNGWLVDASHGVVYGWAAMSHQLLRVDVASGVLNRRSVVLVDGPTGSRRNAGPEATAPPPGQAPVLWQPTSVASQPATRPLVGSPDGTLLYAYGLEFATGAVGGGGPASTGVWVFDAATLAIVGHWQPAITYESIGLAAGGHLLVGVGSASTEERSVFGNHGPALAVHLTTDGSVIAIDRQLVLQLGGDPFLLPAGPGP